MATRGSDFSQFSGAQAFIDNMLQGENIRRARQEAELNQKILEAQLLNNETQRRQAEYNLNRAPIDDAFIDKQRQVELFNLEELLRNSVAEGSMPSQGGSFGQIADVSKALPGLEMPMREISYGDMIAQGPFGEFTVPRAEGEARRKAGKRKLELTEQDSIAKQAGTLQSNAQAHQNRLAEAQYKDYLDRKYQKEIVEPREIQKQSELFQHQIRLENIRAASRQRNAASGNSSRIEEYGIATTTGAVPLSKVPKEDMPGVLAWHRENGTVPLKDGTKAEAIRNTVRTAQELLSNMERAALTFDENGMVTNILTTGFGFKPEGFPYTDARLEVGKMREQAILLAAEANKGRPTDKDAFAFETGSMPSANEEPEQRARKIQDAYIKIGNGLKSFGLPDSQIIEIVGADAIPFIDKANEAAKTTALKTQEDNLEIEAEWQSYFNRTKSDPRLKQKVLELGWDEKKIREDWEIKKGLRSN